jgi:hypothetical protein
MGMAAPPAVLLAGRQSDLEARAAAGVVEEHLVEVAHAKEEDRVRDLTLDVVVLPHGRRTVLSLPRSVVVDMT